jgi:hypothetical protein
MKRGMKHGHGIHSWSRSEKYEGEWENGKQGSGTRIWVTGEVYEGDFHMNECNGHGVWSSPDGTKFDGYWLNGKRSGYGKETKRSGEVVEATWKDNEIETVISDREGG